MDNKKPLRFLSTSLTQSHDGNKLLEQTRDKNGQKRSNMVACFDLETAHEMLHVWQMGGKNIPFMRA